MKQSVTESKKEFIRGQFSSRNKDAPQTEEACGAEISVFEFLSRKDRNKFAKMLKDSQAKRGCKLACERVSADCSAVVRILRIAKQSA